jgi:hypothetical protein
MRLDWLLLAVCAEIVVAIKNKSGNSAPGSDIVYGGCSPMGPLSNTFIAKLRLPGFPFEFPSILPGSNDRYLIFPAPDAIADYEASQRRCGVYNGKLVDLETATEMEILACAIGGPSFIGSWIEGAAEQQQCKVLYPGGVISISEDNCCSRFGSICKISSGRLIEGFDYGASSGEELTKGLQL